MLDFDHTPDSSVRTEDLKIVCLQQFCDGKIVKYLDLFAKGFVVGF